MTANRKAELQRKLALRPVPTPPSGLADRIKRDIPKPLVVATADEDRRRLRQAVAFDVRVAASILLLVSSLYLVLHVMSRQKLETNAVTKTASVPQAQAAPPQGAPPAATFADARTDSVVVALAEPKPIVQLAEARAKKETSAREEHQRANEVALDAASRVEGVPASVEGGVEGAVAGGAVGGVAAVAAPPPPPAAAAPLREMAKTMAATTGVSVKTELLEHPTEAGRAILRVSVGAVENATNAQITIDFAAPPRPAGEPLWQGERTLAAGSSVSATYDVPLQKGRIATIHYRDAAHSIDKTVDAAELRKR